MLNDLAISAQGLTRYFGDRVVVDQLDLGVPRRSVTGLLAPMGIEIFDEAFSNGRDHQFDEE